MKEGSIFSGAYYGAVWIMFHLGDPDYDGDFEEEEDDDDFQDFIGRNDNYLRAVAVNISTWILEMFPHKIFFVLHFKSFMCKRKHKQLICIATPVRVIPSSPHLHPR